VHPRPTGSLIAAVPEFSDAVAPLDRLLAIEAGVDILRPLTERNRSVLDDLQEEAGRIRILLEAAAGAPSDPAEALAAAEAAILKVDAQLPNSSFRLLSLSVLTPEKIARYVGLLARNAHGSLERLDRVEILVTRLCAREELDGTLACRPRAEVDALLRLVSGPVRGDPARAAAFFAAASQRLAMLATIDDAFDSGLYLDVRGYKVALKDERLDPDILHAATAFNLAFRARIEELQHAAGISETALAARFRTAEAQIELLFGRGASTLDEVPELSRPTTEPIPKRRWRLRGPRLRTVLRAAGLAIAIAGAALLFLRDRGGAKLVPVHSEELARLSPLLESGFLSAGEDPFLLGKIPAGKWMLMTRAERKMAASTLRNKLRRRHIESAVVFRDDDVLAIQIEQGRVLAVE
jgi:hypothetical protein